MKIGQPFLTIIDYVCTYVRMYVCTTKESLALNLEIGKTNWHSTVIADIRDSALRLVVSQMADPTQFWSAIFMFSSEKGRWQAAIFRPVHYTRVFTTSGCSLHQGVHYIRVFTTSGCSLHQGVHYIRVFTTSGCSLHQGVQCIGVFTTSGCSLHQDSFTIE